MADPIVQTPTTMSTPQAKRRRLDTATKTLHKPFKSPFRTPLKPVLASNPPSLDPSDIVTPQTTPRAPVPIFTSAPGPGPMEPRPLHPKPSTLRSASTHVPTSILARSLQTQKNTPTPVASKAKPSLTREIISLRADVQILSQALALSTSAKDEDLAVLVDRWRAASRAAAEELFAGTRDRVNRMGGVGAWKSREKEQKEWRTKWDREEAEVEMEKRKEQREEADGEGAEYEEYGDGDGDRKNDAVEQEDGGSNDDDSFTMDMMLKTLNIDLMLIGYDKEGQRWVA